jgi:transcriptional antiterminator
LEKYPDGENLAVESLVDEMEGQYYISIFKEEGLHGKDEKKPWKATQ